MWRQLLEFDQLVRSLDDANGDYCQEEADDAQEEGACGEHFRELGWRGGNDHRGAYPDRPGADPDAHAIGPGIAHPGADAHPGAVSYDGTERAQLDSDHEAGEAEVRRRLLVGTRLGAGSGVRYREPETQRSG